MPPKQAWLRSAAISEAPPAWRSRVGAWMTTVAGRGTVILTEAPLVLPAGLGPYRCRDYDELPDRRRCELLLGRFYARPRPSLAHEIVLECVWRHLQGIAAATGGWAYYGPVDLALEDHSVVKPDVFYVSRARRELVSGPAAGTPELVVEVLSLETARPDRREKVSLCARCGIAEYWLIDPGPQVVDILVNEGGRFVVTLPDGGRHRAAAVPGVTLDLAELWSDVEAALDCRLRVEGVSAGAEGAEEGQAR
jgi:Uma2 family endonuclease